MYLIDVIRNIQKEPHPESPSEMNDEPGKTQKVLGSYVTYCNSRKIDRKLSW